MDFATFRRILTAFADEQTDFDVSRGQIVVQIRGEVLTARVRQLDGELVIDDELATAMPARQWVVTRVARLPQLADRILDTVPDTNPFIRPSGAIEDFAERDVAAERSVEDAVTEVNAQLDERPGGTTSLLYLTSDAGEGKTTVISHLARERALAYKQKRSDWLLVPVTLAGRAFMRFDDIVIAEMMNRFRFPYFYYEGFLELVRMGLLVPAFDGFEEMFIEGSSGEAFSALGTLLRSLESSGAVLIAARKAYFEFRNVAVRAQMFDTISDNAVSFARVHLRRWSQAQFIAYGEARGFKTAAALYDVVTERLGAQHAVVTRAVLVKRLLDVAESHESLQALVDSLGSAPADYFHEFVEALLLREANEKWLDRQGETARPLLTVAQHEQLLGMVAQEMWLSNSDVVRHETLNLVADMFVESQALNPAQAHQVRERLPQHSLLATADRTGRQFIFDHEDFRRYFLGESIGQALVDGVEGALRSVLRIGQLPPETCDAIARHVERVVVSVKAATDVLQSVARSDSPSSYTRENCGSLIVRLLDAYQEPVSITGVAFPGDALRGRRLAGHQFDDCDFAATTIADAHLVGVTFRKTRFVSLEMSASAHIDNVVLDHCDVQSVTRQDGWFRTFEPQLKTDVLSEAGFAVVTDLKTVGERVRTERDEESILLERVLRIFLRNTQVNEDVLRRRLGTKANHFFSDVLPELLRTHALEEVPYLGRGHQRRFRLRVPMTTMERVIAASDGRFDQVIAQLAKP